MPTRYAVLPVVAVAAILSGATAVAGDGARSVTGTWRVDQKLSNAPVGDSLTLRQTGARVTGRFRWYWQAEKGFGAPPCYTGRGGTVSGTFAKNKLVVKLVYPAQGGHVRAVQTYEASLRQGGTLLGGQLFNDSGECEGVWGSLWLRRVR